MTRADTIRWALDSPTLPLHADGGYEAGVHAFREGAYLMAKRVMDAFGAALLIILTGPLMLAVAVAIKCTSRGPVLFRQHRAGLNARPFTMFKFRSMYCGAERERNELSRLNDLAEGPCFKLRNDPRLTPLGRLLRRTSIDELPQLFNVLSGQMSLVGPRPLPLAEVCVDTHAERRRLSVKPGLTCLWQISGRCEIPYSEWMLLDLFYISSRSLVLDLWILIRTIPAVLSGRGAF
jgi:lipopolysaccharide/colanic/teichoic acid biosynthesis glycosyltransferase